jgi:pimeloyl-ACP methyl ester carboxylesterase
MIVWGAQDHLIPVSHAYRAHEAIAGSRLEVFSGAGHYPYLEDPERFAAILLDFIRTTMPEPVEAGRLSDRLRSGSQRLVAT